jgi:two-component system KDP operon response regulator KdpE
MPDASKPSPPGARKILVVDDNTVVVKALSLLLTTHGYQVLPAESTEEALRILSTNKPDLILLDLEFPPDPASALNDGIKVAEWTWHFGLAPGVPVFIVSATEPQKYQARALAAGIRNVFHKPVDSEKLLAAIRAELGEAA